MRVWVDGFVMRRFPLTNADYLEYLNAGDRRESTSAEVPGILRGPDGQHRLATDDLGEALQPDTPLRNVDWHQGMAYAQ